LGLELVELANGDVRHERKRERERESMDRTATRHGNKTASSIAEEDPRRLDPNLTRTQPTLRSIRYKYCYKSDEAATASTVSPSSRRAAQQRPAWEGKRDWRGVPRTQARSTFCVGNRK